MSTCPQPAEIPQLSGAAVAWADTPVLLDQSFIADPYAVYELLRDARPVTRAQVPPAPRSGSSPGTRMCGPR